MVIKFITLYGLGKRRHFKEKDKTRFHSMIKMNKPHLLADFVDLSDNDIDLSKLYVDVTLIHLLGDKS